MKLSTKARYSLRACFALASNGGVMSLPNLARSTALSEKYLERLLGLMRKGEVIVSQRGAAGGYALNGGLEEISVAKILRSVGELEISDCDSTCTDSYCPNRKMFRKLSENIFDFFESISLKDFLDENTCKRKVTQKQ